MPGAPEPPRATAPYSRPDEQQVLDALAALAAENGRPVWALEISRRLTGADNQPGRDGRWVAAVLHHLAAQGKVVRVQRWRNATSRWTLPDDPDTTTAPTPPVSPGG